MPNLVGIGSINVDLIVGSAAAEAVDLGDPRLGLTPADIGGEREITSDQAALALGYLSGFDPVVCPGGSALNTVAAVAGTGTPVTVGHIGVCGSAGPPGFSIPEWLDGLGIDTSLVEVVDGEPGLCLAVTRGSERTLLTTGGVNRRLGRWLTERRGAVVDNLVGARAVHVTSLAGLDDLDPLISVLDEVRRREPGVLLSCDPGAIWTSATRPGGADEVMARCHRLLVNRRELAALGGEALLERWPGVERVVVKGADQVDLLGRGQNGVTTRQVTNPQVLGPDEIVDDTGTGDAFAAGYLIGLLGAEPDELAGVRLGMDLARIKLGFPGMSQVGRFAEAVSSQIDRW